MHVFVLTFPPFLFPAQECFLDKAVQDHAAKCAAAPGTKPSGLVTKLSMQCHTMYGQLWDAMVKFEQQYVSEQGGSGAYLSPVFLPLVKVRICLYFVIVFDFILVCVVEIQILSHDGAVQSVVAV